MIVTIRTSRNSRILRKPKPVPDLEEAIASYLRGVLAILVQDGYTVTPQAVDEAAIWMAQERRICEVIARWHRSRQSRGSNHHVPRLQRTGTFDRVYERLRP